MKRLVVGICAAVVCLLLVSGLADAVSIWTVGPGSSYDFDNIQLAVTAAGAGDTIRVFEGTYPNLGDSSSGGLAGHASVVDVKKSLTIEGWGGGEKLIDVTNRQGSASGNNTGFAILANNVTISGFTFYFDNPDGGVGIALVSGASGASDCTITDNVISGFRWGIQQYGSNYYPASGNSILGNTLYGNGYGIELFDAGIDGTLVAGNTAYGNTGGIAIVTAHLGSITNVTVQGNTLYDNTGYAILVHDLFGDGIGVLDNIAITGNYMTNNNMGVYVTSSVPDASGVTVNYNNIVNETPNKWGVYNGATGTLLDAENNWWGHVDGPLVAGFRISEDVDYDPWLTEPIPEPATVLLLGIGLVSLALVRRRRKRE